MSETIEDQCIQSKTSTFKIDLVPYRFCENCAESKCGSNGKKDSGGNILAHQLYSIYTVSRSCLGRKKIQ